MQDDLLVRGRETGAELACYLDCLVLGQAADAAEQRCEVYTIDVLHRQEVLDRLPRAGRRDLADFEDATDIAMRDFQRQPYFVEETIEARLVTRDLVRQQLERDGLVEFQVVCGVGTCDGTLVRVASSGTGPIGVAQAGQ